jgi:hypothetical protein
MNFTFDARELETKLIQPLEGSPLRIRNAVAAALTRTAVAAREAEKREMRDVFDRPTPFTLGSLFVRPATGERPEALMGIKDNVGGSRSAVSWLRWHIKGGLRTQTAYERRLVSAGAMRADQRAVPGKFARLDAFGNFSRGQLVQILSQLRIESSTGSSRALPRILPADNEATQRAKRGTIRRAYNRAGGQYFALPNGRGRLLPGIYIARQFANGRSDPRPVMLFVNRAQYEAGRFDFFYVAGLVIRRELPRQLAGQLARSLLQLQQAPGTRVSVEG